MQTWRARLCSSVGCWMWLLHACADLGPASAAPGYPEGQLTPADEFTLWSASPPTGESNLHRTKGLASPVTADEMTTAAHGLPSLSDVAASGEMTTGPADSTVLGSSVNGGRSSFPAEGEPSRWVSAASGGAADPATDSNREIESGPNSGDTTETPTEEAGTLASTANSSPENGTAATAQAGTTEEAAMLALLYSSEAPLSSPESALGVSRVGFGPVSSGTASSPLSATADVLAEAGVSEGPEELAPTTSAFPSETSSSPSVVTVEPTWAVFLAATASPKETANETPVLETESPGYNIPSALQSPQPSSESKPAPGMSAIGGKTVSLAPAAGGREAVSRGPAGTEGEGVSPSAFASITDSDQASPSWEAGFAHGTTDESKGPTDEEPTKSQLDMSPRAADTELSAADTEEPLTRDTGVLSSAGTSPPSFLEPGLVTAIPTLPGETSFSALTSPIDSPAEPTLPETENTASSLTGVAGALSSSPPPPDTAFGVSVGEEEEAVNPARADMKETSFPPSAGESESVAAKGPAGTQAPGSVTSGSSVSPNAERAPRRSTSAAKAEVTSNAETRRETSPSSLGTELRLAPTNGLPAGETGTLANGETSPWLSVKDGTVAFLPVPSEETSLPGFTSPSESPPVHSAAPGGSVHEVSSTMEISLPFLAHQAVLTPAAPENRGDLAHLVATAHRETLLSIPNVQHATNPSPRTPEMGLGTAAALPAGDVAATASADISPHVPSGDGAGSGRHAPSGGTSPPDLSSFSRAPAEPTTSRMTKSGSSPASFPRAPVSSPVSSEGETGTGTTSSASESGVLGSFPGLQVFTGGSPPATGLATSRTPQPENGHVAPELEATGGSSGASQLSAAPTPARGRGLDDALVPLLGITARQYDAGAGFDEKRTKSIPAGTSEAATSGMGQSATPIPLYPYGAKENDQQYVERRVDFNSPVFRPEIGFPFGKKLHDSLYFTDNGQIIFPASANDVFPSPSPPPGGFNGREKVPMVAVFWHNADFSNGVGTTFYQEFLTLNSAKHPFVQDVEAKIRRYLKTSYTAKWTLKITWEKAPAYPAQTPVCGTNTYQAVLTTDGIKSYALILFQAGGMKWDYTKLSAVNVLMGYSSGDGLYRNDELTRRPPAAKYRPDQFRGSNTGLRGLWVYSLDSRVRVNYRLRCLEWVNLREDPAVWTKELLDQPYPQGRAGLADARETMPYVSTPNKHRAGDRCVYNSRKELIDGRQERARKASRQASPSNDVERKVQVWCCHLAGSPQLCAKYGEKRLKISCAGYRQPNQSTSSEETERTSEERND